MWLCFLDNTGRAMLAKDVLDSSLTHTDEEEED